MWQNIYLKVMYVYLIFYSSSSGLFGDIYYLTPIVSFCIAYFQRYRIHTFGGRELAVNMRGEDVRPYMNLLVQ